MGIKEKVLWMRKKQRELDREAQRLFGKDYSQMFVTTFFDTEGGDVVDVTPWEVNLRTMRVQTARSSRTGKLLFNVKLKEVISEVE